MIVMENIRETTVNKYTNFTAWLKKRIKANRFHILSTVDVAHWPAGRYLQYKGNLYVPLSIDWPEDRDYGILNVKLAGTARKLQSGSSTDIVVLNNQQIKLQVSHELDRKKRKREKEVKNPFEKEAPPPPKPIKTPKQFRTF